MTARTRWIFELAGWLIFVGSACLFLATTIKAGDVIGVIASALFLLACFVFMAPLLISVPTAASKPPED